jgi:hypothetical protein
MTQPINVLRVKCNAWQIYDQLVVTVASLWFISEVRVLYGALVTGSRRDVLEKPHAE